MEKKLTVEEIYQCLGLLNGITQTNQETKAQTVLVAGFVNEKTISEGIRRIANKTAKKLNENYPIEQITMIQSLSFSELYEGKLPDGYKSIPEDEVKLASIKQSKLKELLNSEVTLMFEELPDFKILETRLEEKKEFLSHNYSYLFERIFLNY